MLFSDFAAEIFSAIAGTVVLYLAALARSYVKARIAALDGMLDEDARARLEAAFENAIARAEARGTAATLPEVIEYVRRFNPGDLARFNLSGDGLVKRAEAAIAKSAKDLF